MSEQRKLMNKGEWVLFILAMGLIAYIVLQKYGLNPVQKDETIEILENPGTSVYPPAPAETKDEAWKALAKGLADGEELPASGEGKWQRLGLSEDEIRFYQDVGEQYGWREKKQDAENWLSWLQTTHDTYQKVSRLVGKPDSSLYKRVERNFGVSETQSKKFARQGRKAISEWAAFIYEQRKRNKKEKETTE